MGAALPRAQARGRPRALRTLSSSRGLGRRGLGRRGSGSGRGRETRASTLLGFEGMQIGGRQRDGLSTKERPREGEGLGREWGQGSACRKVSGSLLRCQKNAENARHSPGLARPGERLSEPRPPLKESPHPHPRWAQDKDTAQALSQGHREPAPPSGLVSQGCQRCPPSLPSSYFLMVAFLGNHGSWADEFPPWQ